MSPPEMEGKITPLPWARMRRLNYVRIFPEADETICIAETGSWAPKYFDEMEANAAYIVLACNAYPDLVAEIGRLRELISDYLELRGLPHQEEWVDGGDTFQKALEAHGKLLAALSPTEPARRG